MAKGRKTGGRDFKRGQGGRPKGAKNKIPGTLKASIKRIFEELGAEHPEEWRAAIRKAMKAGGSTGFRYFELAGAYLDGKPVTRVSLETPQPIVLDFGVLQEPAAEEGTKDPASAERTEEVTAQLPDPPAVARRSRK